MNQKFSSVVKKSSLIWVPVLYLLQISAFYQGFEIILQDIMSINHNLEEITIVVICSVLAIFPTSYISIRILGKNYSLVNAYTEVEKITEKFVIETLSSLGFTVENIPIHLNEEQNNIVNNILDSVEDNTFDGSLKPETEIILGAAALSAGRFKSAKKHLKIAVNISTENDDFRNLTGGYLLLGRMEILQQERRFLEDPTYKMDTELARKYFDTAHELSKKYSFKDFEANALRGICSTLEKNNDWLNAEEYAYMSLAIEREICNPTGIIDSLITVSEITAALGEHDTARIFANEALSVNENVGLPYVEGYVKICNATSDYFSKRIDINEYRQEIRESIVMFNRHNLVNYVRNWTTVLDLTFQQEWPIYYNDT